MRYHIRIKEENKSEFFRLLDTFENNDIAVVGSIYTTSRRHRYYRVDLEDVELLHMKLSIPEFSYYSPSDPYAYA